MNKPSELAQHCREMLERGMNHEELVGFLRSSGLSKVTSLPLLVRVLSISLERAKVLVHNSPTWNDVRARDEEFHTSLQAGEEENDAHGERHC